MREIKIAGLSKELSNLAKQLEGESSATYKDITRKKSSRSTLKTRKVIAELDRVFETPRKKTRAKTSSKDKTATLEGVSIAMVGPSSRKSIENSVSRRLSKAGAVVTEGFTTDTAALIHDSSLVDSQFKAKLSKARKAGIAILSYEDVIPSLKTASKTATELTAEDDDDVPFLYYADITVSQLWIDEYEEDMEDEPSLEEEMEAADLGAIDISKALEKAGAEIHQIDDGEIFFELGKLKDIKQAEKVLKKACGKKFDFELTSD